MTAGPRDCRDSSGGKDAFEVALLQSEVLCNMELSFQEFNAQQALNSKKPQLGSQGCCDHQEQSVGEVFRVANKDMTYAQQLKDYENAVIQKRFEELSDGEVTTWVRV